jgi:nucleoid-associated protein YgaU
VLSVLLLLSGVVSTFAAPPSVPRTNEVAHYERESPVFRSKTVSRERGDALLAALDGGRQIQKRQIPPGVVCALPVPARHCLAIILTNGSAYRICLSFDGGLVYLPEGLYEVTEAARQKVTQVARQLDEDLRREIVNTPKPFVYTVSTIDDGRTLSGIARVFYGDASKWRRIYEANRKTIKNPDVIDGGMKLIIPKLE